MATKRTTKKTTQPKLSTADLLRASRRGEGFGYFGHDIRQPAAWVHTADPYSVVRLLDEAVVARANQLGMTSTQLFEFGNSRMARHACDGVSTARPVVEACDVVADAVQAYYVAYIA